MITYRSVDGVKIIGTSEQYNKYKKSLEEQIKLLKEQNKELSRELDKFRPFSCSYNMVREIKNLKQTIREAINYTKRFFSIEAYYEYVDDDGYDETDIEEDFQEELLEILEGKEND